MIALPFGLPLVRWHNRRAIPLSEGWLTESIDLAARSAGYPSWECTPDMVRAICAFLQQEYPATQITPATLVDLMRRSAHGIGHRDIAERMRLAAPRVSIYLPDLARRPSGELWFFGELQRRLDEALQTVVGGVQLTGIRPCVKRLRCARRWQSACQELHNEIVTFTRSHLEHRSRAPVELLIH